MKLSKKARLHLATEGAHEEVERYKRQQQQRKHKRGGKRK